MARQFGNTAWGQAWLDALEERALVDPNRLPRGRTYARQGRVSDVELGPGLVRAVVLGNDVYRSQMGVRRLGDDEWDELFDRIMGKASFTAALLSGELPDELGEAVLPSDGDLAPDCTCPDWAETCKHIAALCYVIADTFDADPFALLLLRGRGRDELLAEVRARRAEALGALAGDRSDQPRGADPGMNAAAAYRRMPVPMQRAARLPRRAGSLPTLAAAPPLTSGIDEDELGALVADAAGRAFAMLAEGAESGLGLSVGQDVARRAADGDIEAISDATGIAAAELEAAAVAWRHGGAAGLAVARQRWHADPAQLRPGVEALGPGARVRGNAVGAGRIQLRLDESGRWWRFRADDRLGWVLDRPSADEPAELVD